MGRHAEAFGLQGPEAYAYTSLSNCLDVPGIDDSHDFSETIVSDSISCMEDIELIYNRKRCKSLG